MLPERSMPIAIMTFCRVTCPKFQPISAQSSAECFVYALSLPQVKWLVEDAVSHGAHVVMGGKQPPEGGLFYEPTLLTGATKQMKLYSEEIFGPVVAIYKFSSEEEAVQMANDTNKGLAGARTRGLCVSACGLLMRASSRALLDVRLV